MRMSKIIGMSILFILFSTKVFALEEFFITFDFTLSTFQEELNQSPLDLDTTFATTPVLPQIPSSKSTEVRQAQEFKLPEVQRFIEEFQEQNSKFIDILIDPKLQLPYDAVYINQNGISEIQHSATTGSEIGFWLVYLADIAKGDIKVSNITPQQALDRLNTALTNIEKLPKWHGLLYKYNFNDNTIDKMACIFDNGNFAASLGTVIGAFVDEQDDPDKKAIVNLAKKILQAQKPGWEALYDKRTGLLWGDYKKTYPFNILGSEGRLGAIMAIVTGDINLAVWKSLDHSVKSYTLNDGKNVEIMPPYEGAFQLYFPLMFIPEDEWSEGFDKAHNNYAAVQIDYANETNLPALRSACANPYYIYGYDYVAGTGVPEAFSSKNGISRSDIGATYAIAFLNLIAPEKAIKLFQELGKFTQGKIWGPYGMYDSVGTHGEVSKIYLSLDHLPMLISMAGKVNQKYFTRFLEAKGKLDLVKELYQQTEIQIDKEVVLPEVKEFDLPTPSPEVIPPTGKFTLTDFEEKVTDYVPSFGHFDGPGGEQRDNQIHESVKNLPEKGKVLKAEFYTKMWNGIYFKLTNLQPLENYDKIFLDIKSSGRLDSLKIELKGNQGGHICYHLSGIGPDWRTYKISVNKFRTVFGGKIFHSGEIPIELVITIEGRVVENHSFTQEGILYIDNISMETNE